MFKTTALLFVLGVALGLWLGFNPQTHGKVMRSWDDTKAFFAKLETNAAASINHWTNQANTQAQTGQRAVSKVTARPFTDAWRQFVSAWTTFMVSLQKIWQELVSNINWNKS